MVRRAHQSFRGAMVVRFLIVVTMAVVTGATAGILPAVLGQAVAAVTGGGGGEPPGGFARLAAQVMPGDSTWAVVVVTLVATVVTVGIGVLSSTLGSSLSGDVTAALRVELMAAVLGASARDVAEAGKEITAPRRPPGMGPPKAADPPGGTAPPGARTPTGAKAPGPRPGPGSESGATREAVVRLAVSREAALISDFAVSVSTGLPQSIATLLVLGVELITGGAWHVLAGGAGLFVLSRLLADRASRRVGVARRELQNADAVVFGNLQETLAATEDLRLWGARGQAVREFAEVAHACARARSRFAVALAVSGQIKSVFTAMAPLLVVVTLPLSGRTYDAGDVAKLLLLVPLLMIRLEALDAIRQGLIERAPLLEAAKRLLDLEQAPPRAADARRLDADAVQGQITFTKVSFTPPGASAPVIDDVTLDIPAGSIVGVCGPSGSGKSSLLRLLLRLDDPDEGTIELDGQDLRRVEPDQLPALFGVVRQTARLLQRSVRDNLAVGLEPPPDDRRMKAALEAVHLGELAQDEPGRSLATAYRANPPNFSGGECRRLLLARMLLGSSRVCLLDEPEAGLPSGTAEDILRTVAEQAEGRTHVVVTHAPHVLGSTFNVVLDRGKIVAHGPHHELVETCECYRDLLADGLDETDD
ncbi:MAG: ABC transporter ATP-binding protein [Deltaproteobacteria bacterium]|nr:ABC transporter ATP-binding protein [Deltaproteobacteria bacterium]